MRTSRSISRRTAPIADGMLATGVQTNNEAVVQRGGDRQGHATGPAKRVGHGGVDQTRGARGHHQGVARQAAAGQAPPAFTVNPSVLPKYVGNYRDAASGISMTVSLQNGALMLQVQGSPPFVWCPPRKTCSASSRSMPRSPSMNAAVSSNRSGWSRGR